MVLNRKGAMYCFDEEVPGRRPNFLEMEGFTMELYNKKNECVKMKMIAALQPFRALEGPFLFFLSFFLEIVFCCCCYV